MIKLLLAEDDASTREGLRDVLMTLGYEVMVVSNGIKAWEIISSIKEPIFVMLDHDMPGMTGMEILMKIQELQKEEDSFIYPIILTGALESEPDVPAKISNFVMEGSKAVLRKPVQFIEIFAHIRMAEEALKRARSRENMLRRDPLTGFYNQLQGVERLREEMERAKRSGKGLAFVFIDLDFFKSVNDEHGHQFGSETLRIVARRIDEKKRAYDIAIRYGGDEFALILPEIQSDEVKDKVERILKHISQPIKIHSTSLVVTASIGLAMMGIENDAEALMERADSALYEAKRKGRNRIETSLH